MPIKSYIALSFEGKRKELRSKILEIAPSSLAVEADNCDLLVISTDFPSEREDKETYSKFLDIPEMKNLTFVSGYSEEAISLENTN